MFVTDALRWWARDTPDNAAIVFEGDVLTYAELDRWSDAVAVHLASLGVQAGDRVGVVGANSLSWCAALFGVLKAGCTMFPINARFVAAEIAHLLTDTGAVAVLTDDAHRDVLDETAVLGPAPRQIGFDVVAGLRHTTVDKAPRPVISMDDPLVIVYTSGSTGRPKGVVITHRTEAAMAFEWGLTERGVRRGMRWLCVLPLGGMPSILWGLCLTAFNGGTSYVLPTFGPEEVLAAIEEHRITTMFSVPTIFELAMSSSSFASADLSSLETVHTGGARVSAKVLDAWMGKGVTIRQIYGLTEVGGSMSAVPLAAATTRADTCGHGGMFSRFRTVRPDGTPCDPGEPGEILVWSPAQTPGYWHNPEATAQLITDDGWLRTGDLGVIDEQGYLKFLDRLKELIISGGINIAPLEIENTMAEVEGVVEVAVVAVPHPKFGETPGAVIRLKPGTDLDDVLAHCRSQLSSYKVPQRVLVVDEPLPRLQSGKLAKPEIKRDFIPRLAELPS